MITVAVALLAAAAVAGAAPDFGALPVQRMDPPKPAPAFELPDLSGRTHRLADLRGKVVLLFFWATWCPDCRKDLPSVSALSEEFRGKGLEVRLINFREDPALVRRTVEERGYKPPVLLDQSGDLTGRVYGVWGPPTAYLVDREGRLIGRIVGPRAWDSPRARAFVQDLLDLPAR
jgi:peroxiredoxin